MLIRNVFLHRRTADRSAQGRVQQDGGGRIAYSLKEKTETEGGEKYPREPLTPRWGGNYNQAGRVPVTSAHRSLHVAGAQTGAEEEVVGGGQPRPGSGRVRPQSARERTTSRGDGASGLVAGGGVQRPHSARPPSANRHANQSDKGSTRQIANAKANEYMQNVGGRMRRPQSAGAAMQSRYLK